MERLGKKRKKDDAGKPDEGEARPEPAATGASGEAAAAVGEASAPSGTGSNTNGVSSDNVRERARRVVSQGAAPPAPERGAPPRG